MLILGNHDLERGVTMFDLMNTYDKIESLYSFYGGKSDMQQIRVTVWNEYRHERENEGVRKIYPKGIHIPDYFVSKNIVHTLV